MRNLIKQFTFIYVTTQVLFIQFAYTQEIVNIGIENGLSNNQAYSINQDSKGFIWISTKQGIDRFDGIRITNYSFPVKLAANSHIKLLVDKKKNLWAYTSLGDICSFSYNKNKFILHSRISTPIYSTSFDSQNRLWLVTKTGVYLINQNKLIKKISGLYNVIQYFDSNHFLLADNNVVYLYNTNNNTIQKITEFKVKSQNQKSQNIASLYFDHSYNQLWIGTINQGVYCYDMLNKALIRLKDKVTEIPSVPVWSIKSYSNDLVCFSTDGAGIFLINKKDHTLQKRIQEDVNASNSIKGNGIYDIFVDDHKTLYSVSFTGGLSIIKSQNKNFDVLHQERNNKNSLSNNVVRAIHEDTDGDLWFATYNGVNCLDTRTQQWSCFSDYKDNFYLSLTEDQNGNILAGSYSQGITVLNKHKGIIGHIYPKDTKREIGTNFIMALLFDEDENLWSGGCFGELSCYQPAKGKFKYFNITDVNALCNNDSSSILVASSVGAYIINFKTFQVRELRFGYLKNKAERLMFNTVTKIDENNTVWWGSEGEGLFCWDGIKQKVKRFTVKDGLPSDYVVSLLYDKDSLIWGGTDNGLFSINMKTSRVISYSTKEGLSANNFSRHSMAITHKKELLFGTNNGITRFYSHQEVFDYERIKLYIDEFRIFNQPVVAAAENSILKEDIDITKNISLDWTKHSFAFSFGSIDLQNNKQVYYQWKLEGLDNDWNYSSLSTLASYTNVQPGRYEFVLRAISKSSKNEFAEKRINIIVRPPFWKTWWARLIFLLITVLVFRAIYIYYKKKRIQRYSDEKIDFFTKTAHDIKTPLALIQAPLNELKKTANLNDKEQYFIELAVSNVERLNMIVNQLMDFQKSDTLKSQLMLSSIDVVEFLREKVEVFSILAQRQSVKVLFNPLVTELNAWLDVEKFDRIIDNLISNALKYSAEEGVVEISVKTEANDWILTVSDNGIGISEKDQSKLFQHFYRGENAINSNISGSGVGLLLTKNYTLLHKGKISFISTPGVGSTFTINFKQGKSHFNDDVIYSDKVTFNEDPKTAIVPGVKHMKHSSSDNKVKILLVEDNHELREFVQTILSFNFYVESTENGKEALKALEKFSADLIISDVQMPEMDGLTFSQKIKNTFETSHIPIILLSALTQKNQILKGLEIGVDDYITKPFDIDLLIAKINTILKNRELVRAQFLDNLDDNKVKVEIIPNRRDKEFIEKALSVIHAKMFEFDFNKDFLAREMAVSQSLLYSKIKHLSGEAPSDLIRIVRLKRSMELLKKNQYPISEVAFMCGFNDAKYFSTVFKKYYGKTPSEIKG